MFLAWGSPAQKRCDRITGLKHVVLKSVHPSPLSAHKGFFDCGHFKKANEWLESRYGAEGVIDWNLNVQKPIKAPDVQEPVKVTETQAKKPEEDGPVTELSEKKSDDGKDHKVVEQDEFASEDDDDALAALDEAVKLEAEQDKKET